MRELYDQIALLQDACSRFDTGLEAIGKHIGLNLRVLLHEHGKSRSLLDQLKFRDGWFYDSAGPLHPSNLLPECNLVALRVGNQSAYIPVIAVSRQPPRPYLKVPFVTWWNRPVCKDAYGARFNRRELISNVVNTDGGAHVDPALDAAYEKFTRQNGLGWVLRKGDIQQALVGRPELACMRQIAHEVFLTMEERILPKLHTTQ
ncbi:MAG: hypothetical protein ACRESO_01470 [Gammaproteobacteria bacterium]